MSSISDDHSDSEGSYEQLEDPQKVTKVPKRERTSDSDDSDESTNSSASKVNYEPGSAPIAEDPELSDSESDASVRKNQKPTTLKNSVTSVKHNSDSESDSSAGSMPFSKVKVKEEKESSSDEASKKPETSSSSDEASEKSESSSSDEAPKNSESSSSSDEGSKKSEPSFSNTSNKKVKKIDRQGRKGKSFVKDSHTHHVEQESVPHSSSEDDGTSDQSSSPKEIKRKSKLFSLVDYEESIPSKSSNTDEQNVREGNWLEDEDDPKIAEVEPSVLNDTFGFSEENLVQYSSGIIDLETLTNNDFWLIHSPKMLTNEDLKGANLNFNLEKHHKIGGQKYQMSLYPEEGVVACVLPSKKAKQFLIVGLTVKGSAVFEELVKLPKPGKPQPTIEDSVKFPENLRVRHPLFGADYKERISKGPESNHREKTSKKKKSKGKDRLENGNESVAATNFPGSRLNKSPEKEKKRDSLSNNHSATVKANSKRRGSSESNDLINESSSKSPKKRKREKLEDDSAHSEFVEEPQMKKRKAVKLEDESTLNVCVESSKIKKRKIENSEEESFKTPSENAYSKKRSLDDTFLKTIANIKEEVLSSSEMSFESEKRNKKKKKEKRKSKSDC